MRFLILSLFLFSGIIGSSSAQSSSNELVKIGTKVFTESVILGEVLKQSIESDGYQTEFYDQLGGTRILWNALVDGEIDVYPDYTGTIIEEILASREIDNRDDLIAVLDEFGIEISEPLGFNNTYALGMKRERADELEIETISDLQDHPELTFLSLIHI